jgi:flagellar biosynthesis/type III secretory pathway M-ring protein FliF/YscJ
LIAFFALRRRGTAPTSQAPMTLKPGMNVAEIEAGQSGARPPTAELKALPDPAISLRERARVLAAADPARTAHLLRAWISSDVPEPKEAPRG